MVIAETIGDTPEGMYGHLELIDDLRLDSLDVWDIVMGIESHFAIDVANEDVERVRTVADIETMVLDKGFRRLVLASPPFGPNVYTDN